ncbi:exosortase system-associated protein, TIGR04073 family [Methylobacter sp. Wu1]|jgi:putative exosortase-associated protein (TIGR04073 family)|uniref:exosortase system-associated protein, TIGR04073 family n=1 Tax=Methylobacter sp. Wu1 TaxID=3119359 RepID=UPI002F93C816
MYKFKPMGLALVLAVGIYAPVSQADNEQSYFDQVGDKFLTGSANLFTGIGEVPKNIVNMSKDTNPIVGATGGLIYGTLHTLGRTASGVFDVLTSPIPTKSMAEPKYVWSDFDQTTTYGGTFE